MNDKKARSGLMGCVVTVLVATVRLLPVVIVLVVSMAACDWPPVLSSRWANAVGGRADGYLPCL
jgi:ABC-type spermidine/putrescine transport system permease subunit II